MKAVRSIGLLGFLLLTILLSAQVYAACNPDGTAGNDVIVCDNAPDDINGISGGDGDDQITINAGATVSGTFQTVNGAGGNDLIINNGTVSGVIFGGYAVPTGSDTIINNGIANEIIADGTGGTVGGADTIVNNGTVLYNINGSDSGDTITNNGTAGTILLGMGSAGGDTIINNGTLSGSILGALGTNDINRNQIVNNGTVEGSITLTNDGDTVILQDSANGGGDHYLVIEGGFGANVDRLVFEFSFSNDDAFDDFAALIASKNPTGDSVTVNGQTFEWRNFEELSVNRATNSNDGRLNAGIQHNGRTAAVYCSEYEDGGVIVYGIDANGKGYLLFSVSSEAAHDALEQAQANGEHVMIAEADGQSLWALTSNELQVHDTDGLYDFIFAPTVCGIPLAS